MVNRRALLVGVSYAGSEAELAGCINDVNMMKKVLLKHYNFAQSEIVVMTDTQGRQQPTGENIRKALEKMAKEAVAGDVLVFHFSGHGSTVPSEDEDDGLNEVIVPCDNNVISDDDLTEIFSHAPAGINFTMIADCCHSGGLFDKTKVQELSALLSEIPRIVMEEHLESLCLDDDVDGDVDDDESEEWEECSDETLVEPKMKTKKTKAAKKTQALQKTARKLTSQQLCEQLSKQSGTQVSVKDMRGALTNIFGSQASRKFSFSKSFRKMLVGDTSFKISQGVLVSACREHELASDCRPEGGLPHGALTKAIYDIHEKIPEDYHLSNQNLINFTAYILAKNEQSQVPCLYCSNEALQKPFITGGWL